MSEGRRSPIAVSRRQMLLGVSAGAGLLTALGGGAWLLAAPPLSERDQRLSSLTNGAHHVANWEGVGIVLVCER